MARACRTPLILVAALVFLANPYADGAAPPVLDRPSILLVTIDTLRADHLPFYGYTRDTAPFLSTLAGASTTYANAYSTSSWTVPAVASMVTGVYPHSHGAIHGFVKDDKVARQEALPSSLPVLAESLQQLGYRTFGVVANLHLDRQFGFARGFDRFRCVGFTSADRVNATALQWREQLDVARGPVFLWLHYFDPHHQYHDRQPFFDAFKPPSAECIAQVRNTTFEQIVAKWMKTPDPSVAPLVQSHYDSEIRYVDQHLRALFHELPFLDRCFAVFTSDHGEEFLDHGTTGHGLNLYNETVRVPLVVRPPGGGAPAYRTDTVSLIDVAPTILAAAGGTAPAEWQGAVIVDRHGSPVPHPDRMVLSDLARNRRLPRKGALAGSRWKIVVNIDTGVAELFDLRRDPRERVDLAADNARLVGAFFARLDALIRSLPPAPDTVTHAVDEQTAEQLRLLGYVEAPSPPPRAPAPTPTP